MGGDYKEKSDFSLKVVIICESYFILPYLSQKTFFQQRNSIHYDYIRCKENFFLFFFANQFIFFFPCRKVRARLT